MKSFKRLVSITIISLFTIIVISGEIFSGPNKYFDENGLNIWANSDVVVHGAFKTFNGERIMLIWSETKIDVGVRHVYMQMIESNGDLVYDTPIQLSSNDLKTIGGSANIDSEGQIFLQFTSVEFDDEESVTLFMQLYDTNGEPVWSDDPIEVLDFHGDGDMFSDIIPDDRGGVYIRTADNGFLAVDNDGEIRDGWPWFDESPEDEENMSWIISDGVGGLWYVIYIQNDEHHWRLNHLDYEGEKMWDEPQLPGFPDLFNERVRNIKNIWGHEGGVIANFNFENIFHVNAEGRHMGRDFIHTLPAGISDWSVSIGENRYFTYMIYSDNNLRATSNLVSYNTENNDFPWDIEGVLIYSQSDLEGTPIAKTLNVFDFSGNSIIASLRSFSAVRGYKNNLIRLDRRGDQIWHVNDFADEFEFTTGFSHPEAGFWIFGKTEDEAENSVPVPDEYHLNFFNSDGSHDIEGGIDFGLLNRDRLTAPLVWNDEENNYRILFGQPHYGLTMKTINPDGWLEGELSGELLIPIEADNTYFISKSINLPDKIITMWGMARSLHEDEYLFSEIHFSAFDLTGDSLWTIDPVTNSNIMIGSFDLDIIPDNQHIALSVLETNGASLSARVYMVDHEEGEITWNNVLPNTQTRREYGSGYNQTVIGDNIYNLAHNNNDTAFVYASDLEGNILWDAPYIHPIEYHSTVIGIASRTEGGLWVVHARTWAEDEGFTEIWASALSAEGEVLDDSISFAPERYEIRWNPSQLVLRKSGENLWLFNTSNRGFGIQCVSEAGEYQLPDEQGFKPDVQNTRALSEYVGQPDGEGGMWVLWQDGSDPVYNSISAIYFDSNGDIHEGWDDSGYEVLSTLEMDGHDQFFINSIDGTDLIVIGNNKSSYKFQHVIDGELGVDFSDEIHSPAKFSIDRVFPNPFNSTVRLQFTVPRMSNVSIKLYDLRGSLVDQIVGGVQQTGQHSITWNASNMPSGIYFARMEANEFSHTVKLMLMK